MIDGRKLSVILKQKKITSERLMELLLEYGINLSLSSIKKYRIGGVDIPSSTVSILAKILDIPEQDLFEDADKKIKNIVKRELKGNIESYVDLIPSITIPSSIKHVRVVKGYPTTSTNNIVQEDSMHYVTKIYIDKRMVKTAYQDKELEAAVMIGDSMSPYLENDDIAIYHPTSTPLGDGRYVINTPCGLTVKKLKFMSSGSVLLISENSTYNTHGTFDEEFTSDIVDTLEIYGLVVGRILKS